MTLEWTAVASVAVATAVDNNGGERKKQDRLSSVENLSLNNLLLSRQNVNKEVRVFSRPAIDSGRQELAPVERIMRGCHIRAAWR